MAQPYWSDDSIETNALSGLENRLNTGTVPSAL